MQTYTLTFDMKLVIPQSSGSTHLKLSLRTQNTMPFHSNKSNKIGRREEPRTGLERTTEIMSIMT